jgi:hypothetical protein
MRRPADPALTGRHQGRQLCPARQHSRGRRVRHHPGQVGGHRSGRRGRPWPGGPQGRGRHQLDRGDQEAEGEPGFEIDWLATMSIPGNSWVIETDALRDKGTRCQIVYTFVGIDGALVPSRHGRVHRQSRTPGHDHAPRSTRRVPRGYQGRASNNGDQRQLPQDSRSVDPPSSTPRRPSDTAYRVTDPKTALDHQQPAGNPQVRCGTVCM